MLVGDIVKLKEECLGNAVGTLGVCYNTALALSMASFIFENGKHDVFDKDEQAVFFEYMKNVKLDYKHEGTETLSDSFKNGVFDNFLKRVHNEKCIK